MSVPDPIQKLTEEIDKLAQFDLVEVRRGMQYVGMVPLPKDDGTAELSLVLFQVGQYNPLSKNRIIFALFHDAQEVRVYSISSPKLDKPVSPHCHTLSKLNSSVFIEKFATLDAFKNDVAREFGRMWAFAHGKTAIDLSADLAELEDENAVQAGLLEKIGEKIDAALASDSAAPSAVLLKDVKTLIETHFAEQEEEEEEEEEVEEEEPAANGADEPEDVAPEAG